MSSERQYYMHNYTIGKPPSQGPFDHRRSPLAPEAPRPWAAGRGARARGHRLVVEGRGIGLGKTEDTDTDMGPSFMPA